MTLSKTAAAGFVLPPAQPLRPGERYLAGSVHGGGIGTP